MAEVVCILKGGREIREGVIQLRGESFDAAVAHTVAMVRDRGENIVLSFTLETLTPVR